MARDPWYDNAKMALVLLVVVGHSWVMLPHNTLDAHLYWFLYAWHVPAFVFVTGYLSRSFDWSGRRMWQLVRTVAIPYVLFEAAMALFRVYVGGENLKAIFQDPHWPMWYLAAMFFWRLATPVFKAAPGAVALAAAVAISLAGGFWADTTFDFYRVCGLLPFFVLGLAATPERMELLRRPAARAAAVTVFAALALVTTWTPQLIGTTDWFYYSYGYASLGYHGTEALAIRSALLVVGALAGLSFFALVPRVHGWFTRMGAATLVVYLFHGFVVKSVEYAGFPAWADGHATTALLLTTLGAAAVAMLLASRPVSSRLVHLVDPFGYAERHVTHAVALAEAPAEAEVISTAVQEVAAEVAARETLVPR